MDGELIVLVEGDPFDVSAAAHALICGVMAKCIAEKRHAYVAESVTRAIRSQSTYKRVSSADIARIARKAQALVDEWRLDPKALMSAG